jgi:hypothetical protein
VQLGTPALDVDQLCDGPLHTTCCACTCSWRYIKFDGKDKLLVTIGAPCNVCILDDPSKPAGDGGTGKFAYGE